MKFVDIFMSNKILDLENKNNNKILRINVVTTCCVNLTLYILAKRRTLMCSSFRFCFIALTRVYYQLYFIEICV